MTVKTDVVIIGAGPYGLSIAAHLREQGVNFKIVGSPMHSWLTKMPKGMLLKSPGFASNLCDPGGTFTFRRFCEAKGIPYQDIDLPIPLETFCEYGMAFQKRFAPDLEEDNLVSLDQGRDGFKLLMASGKVIRSRSVVLAIGIDYFRNIPGPLARLPRQFVSHSGDHQDLEKLKGQEVAVLGGGSSAIDIAVLLHEAKIQVRHIVRKDQLDFGNLWLGSRRPLWRRIREPISGIGPGWKSRLCTEFPWLYRHLPDGVRVRIAKTHLGPSGGWSMKARAASVPTFLGYRLHSAAPAGNRVHLSLFHSDGRKRNLVVDHVIAATGYHVDMRRLPFLSEDIIKQLQVISGSPRLSANFESSVPGLYLVGAVAAVSFGPVMRFVAGAEFTSRHLARHLARLSEVREPRTSELSAPIAES